MSDYNEDSYQIAIIGLSCRFPKAKNVTEFWNNLINAKECTTFFSEGELLKEGVLLEHLRDKSYIRCRPYVEDIEMFDAEFFKENSRGASLMDPQHRLFLECSWEALEDAGCVAEQNNRKIGVFASCDTNTYLLSNVILNDPNIIYNDPLQLKMNDKDYLCSRVSHKLNLSGPSIMIQSACSSSLAAVHMASESILNGECDMALAGAVSLTLPNKSGYFYKQGGVVSKDGHCRPFDKGASGTVYGDGVGVVVLKRFSDALEEHDNIYAVIKGISMNNDGGERSGYTAPGLKGQTAVIRDTIEIAEIDVDNISYVEAHGTGTTLGDAIEIAALTKAFRSSTQRKNYCGIGTAKSNIGHSSTASGIAGLIKVALSLHHEKLPPSINYEKPSESINFKESPFYVVCSLKEWKRGTTPRVAGISAFGLGGSNVHMILSESPAILSNSETGEYIINLSARSEEALGKMEGNLLEFLERNKTESVDNIAFTLQTGRKEFRYRSAMIGSTSDEIYRVLKEKKYYYNIMSTELPDAIFMFNGVGEEYVGVTKGLYNTMPVFRKYLSLCADMIKRKYNIDILNTLFTRIDEEAKHGNKKGIFSRKSSLSGEIQELYLVVFSIEYSLAQFLIEIGIKPSKMIGYSIGEYTAACLAGVFSLEDTIDLLYHRGCLTNNIKSGAMMTVMLSKEKLEDLLDENVWISVINSPNICVVGGERENIDKLETLLLSQGIACKRIPTTHAFHTPIMMGIREEYWNFVDAVPKKAPIIPFVSNITGDFITDELATSSDYWSDHLLKPVQFSKGIETLIRDNGNSFFIEACVGNTLSMLLNQNDAKRRKYSCSIIRSHYEEDCDGFYLKRAIAKLWCAGYSINWSTIFDYKNSYKISMPTYPFERRRYWLEPNISGFIPFARMEENILRKDIRDVEGVQLQSIERESMQSEYEVPVTKIQIELLYIWEKTLGYTNIGIRDEFFEIGGNSLLAINILFEIKKKFEVELSLERFYKKSSIKDVSQDIETYNWFKNNKGKQKEVEDGRIKILL